MLGTGNYQRFVQRIPNLIPSLLGFVELAKYFENRLFKHLFFSLVLFVGGLILGQFSTFVLLLYVIYAIVTGIRSKNIRIFLLHAVISILYFLVNLLLIKSNSLYPSESLLDFFQKSHPLTLVKAGMVQLGNMALPVELLHAVAAISSPFDIGVIFLTLPLIACLLGCIFILRKANKPMQNFYITCLLSVIGLLFLNLFLGKVNPLFNIRGYEYYFLPEPYHGLKELVEKVKGDRYYQLPYVLLSFMFVSIIWQLLPQKSRRFAPFLVAAFVIYNTFHVWKSFDQIQYASDITKVYLKYVKSISGKLQPNSIIVTRMDFIWPSPFIRSTYAFPDTQFTAYTNNWNISDNNRDRYILLDFDYKKNEVVDLTDRYREGQEVHFLNTNGTSK